MASVIKQNPTVRISERSHSVLRELSAKYGEPMQNVLDEALESYRRRRFFEELGRGYAAILTDPEAGEAERREFKMLEGTLMDGLDPGEVWTEKGFVREDAPHG